jgi:hypothetical protein
MNTLEIKIMLAGMDHLVLRRRLAIRCKNPEEKLKTLGKVCEAYILSSFEPEIPVEDSTSSEESSIASDLESLNLQSSEDEADDPLPGEDPQLVDKRIEILGKIKQLYQEPDSFKQITDLVTQFIKLYLNVDRPLTQDEILRRDLLSKESGFKDLFNGYDYSEDPKVGWIYTHQTIHSLNNKVSPKISNSESSKNLEILKFQNLENEDFLKLAKFIVNPTHWFVNPIDSIITDEIHTVLMYYYMARKAIDHFRFWFYDKATKIDQAKVGLSNTVSKVFATTNKDDFILPEAHETPHRLFKRFNDYYLADWHFVIPLMCIRREDCPSIGGANHRGRNFATIVEQGVHDLLKESFTNSQSSDIRNIFDETPPGGGPGINDKSKDLCVLYFALKFLSSNYNYWVLDDDKPAPFVSVPALRHNDKKKKKTKK